MGRPDSELYRGVRLLQALDWQARANPDLTGAERDFLDAGAERDRAESVTAEQRLSHQARQNRRLRALLAGVGALLVVAVVAGLLALRQAERSDRASVVADAGRVGAQALLVDDVDQALLLAAEAVRLDDSVGTRSNLLGVLSRAPELIASTRSEGSPFQSVEVTPDGGVVAVGQTNSDILFYDGSTAKSSAPTTRCRPCSSSSGPTACSSR